MTRLFNTHFEQALSDAEGTPSGICATALRRDNRQSVMENPESRIFFREERARFDSCPI
jgi:hypothetical protein